MPTPRLLSATQLSVRSRDVLKALQAHDAELAETLDSLARDLGRGAGGLKLSSKIHLDLPATVGADFAAAFAVRTVEATTRPWELWYGLLEAYAEEYGHTRVPNEAEYHGAVLGGWVREQTSALAQGRPGSRACGPARDDAWLDLGSLR